MNITKVQNEGKNQTSRELSARRKQVQCALEWLKINNPTYSGIIICQTRLNPLPEEGEITHIPTAEYNAYNTHVNDLDTHVNYLGPAPEQMKQEKLMENFIHCTVTRPSNNLQQDVTNIVKGVIGESHGLFPLIKMT